MSPDSLTQQNLAQATENAAAFSIYVSQVFSRMRCVVTGISSHGEIAPPTRSTKYGAEVTSSATMYTCRLHTPLRALFSDTRRVAAQSLLHRILAVQIWTATKHF